jgi:hypothetical protein
MFPLFWSCFAWSNLDELNKRGNCEQFEEGFEEIFWKTPWLAKQILAQPWDLSV